MWNLLGVVFRHGLKIIIEIATHFIGMLGEFEAYVLSLEKVYIYSKAKWGKKEMLTINLRHNELDKVTKHMSFVGLFKLLTAFLVLSLLHVSFAVQAQEKTQTLSEQRALLSSGHWYCPESDDEDGSSYNYF